MSDNVIHTDISIKIVREHEYRQQIIEDSTTNPRGSLAISVDSASIAGGPDTLPISGYIYDLIAHLCNAVEFIQQNENYIVTASGGPAYVALRSESNDVIGIGHYCRKSGITANQLIRGKVKHS